MGELSVLNKYIVDSFNAIDMVNTISALPSFEVDLNKENIFQLVNVFLSETDIQPQLITADYEIIIVQQRNVSPKKLDSKLMDDSNLTDNLNETHFTASKFINKLQRITNTDNIELIDLTPLKKLENWSRNGLDGFRFTITLSIPNKGRTC